MNEFEKSPLLDLLEKHYGGTTKENGEMILALEEKLEEALHRNSINKHVSFWHDFKENPPIFACEEPTNFLDGLARLTERLSLFVHLVARNKEHVGYVRQKVLDAVEAGLCSDFRPFYQDSIEQIEMEYAVAMNKRLDQSRVAANVAALQVSLNEVNQRIDNFDKSDWPERYAECDRKLAKLLQAREEFRRSGALPEGFVISPMFQDFAEDQFAFDEGRIRSERNFFEREFRHLCEERDMIAEKLAFQESELAALENPTNHEDGVKQVVSIASASQQSS